LRVPLPLTASPSTVCTSGSRMSSTRRSTGRSDGLTDDLAAAATARFSLVFGHVPAVLGDRRPGAGSVVDRCRPDPADQLATRTLSNVLVAVTRPPVGQSSFRVGCPSVCGVFSCGRVGLCMLASMLLVPSLSRKRRPSCARQGARGTLSLHYAQRGRFDWLAIEARNESSTTPTLSPCFTVTATTCRYPYDRERRRSSTLVLPTCRLLSRLTVQLAWPTPRSGLMREARVVHLFRAQVAAPTRPCTLCSVHDSPLLRRSFDRVRRPPMPVAPVPASHRRPRSFVRNPAKSAPGGPAGRVAHARAPCRQSPRTCGRRRQAARVGDLRAPTGP